MSRERLLDEIVRARLNIDELEHDAKAERERRDLLLRQARALKDPPSLAELADLAGVHRSYVHRVTKSAR